MIVKSSPMGKKGECPKEGGKRGPLILEKEKKIPMLKRREDASLSEG